MDIRISKESPVPIHEQISGQLVLLIATRKIRPGEVLPGIKTIARNLNVHYNTVSEAMQYLVKWNLVIRRRGARLVVNDPAQSATGSAPPDLDDLINQFIASAQAQGFKERDIFDRISFRLSTQPPERILALSFDPGMCRLFESELRTALGCTVESCSPDKLIASPEFAGGALVISPPGVLPRIAKVLPKLWPPLPALYTDPSPYLDAVRQLRNPSIVALMSISEAFLEIARGVLGPVVSGRHSLVERCIPESGAVSVPAADVILCDVVLARRIGKPKGHSKVLPYPLLSPACIDTIRAVMARSITN